MRQYRKAMAVGTCVLAIAGAACSSGGIKEAAPKKTAPTTVAKSTPTTATTVAVPATTPPASESDLIIKAVSDAAVRAGFPTSSFVVGNVRISSADPNWAEACVDLADHSSNLFQPYTAVAHKENGTWTEVSEGTAQVACGVAPPDVNASFGDPCNTLGYQWHQGGCDPAVQPALDGSWQTSAPRTPIHPGTAGSSMAELGLRLEDGTTHDGAQVNAVLSAPDGSQYFSASVPLPGNEFVNLLFPDDFGAAAAVPPGVLQHPGDYTVLWSASTIGPIACDGFTVQG
jgi:hypothetical protein